MRKRLFLCVLFNSVLFMMDGVNIQTHGLTILKYCLLPCKMGKKHVHPDERNLLKHRGSGTETRILNLFNKINYF